MGLLVPTFGVTIRIHTQRASALLISKGNKEGQYPDWVGEPLKAMFEKKRALNKRRDLALQQHTSSNQCPSANVTGTEEERTGQSAASEWFKQATRSERNAWVADMKKYQKTEQ